MKNKKLLLVFGVIAAVTASASILTDNGKAGKTDSPGEGNCSGCHDNTVVNTGGGSVVVTSNIPSNMYTPGQTYQMTVTVNESGKLLFGLGVEALNSSFTNAGTLVITNPAETHLLTASNGRVNVVHQLDGGLVSTPGSKSFNFDWTAPATDVGYVTFWVGSIAAIGDGDPATDNTYTTTKVFSSPSTVGIHELAGDLQFSVFPNPVKDILNIYYFSDKDGTVEADLYSLTGQKVADLFYESTPHVTVEKQISLPGSIEDGIYFVKIIQGGKTLTKRILIQH